jgi:CHAT domain-containing protein
LVITRKIGNKKGISNNLGNLGLVYRNLGLYPKAIDYYQQSLVIFRELGDKKGISKSLSNLGVVYKNLGQYQEARDYYQQSLVIDREIGNKKGISSNLTNLGVVYKNLGQYPKAIDYYQQSLVIKREIGDKKGILSNLTNLGNVYAKLYQYPKAIDYYQQALVIQRKIGDKKGIGANLTNLGAVYMSLGQYPKAIDYYQQALVIQREIGVINWTTYGSLASAEAHLQLYDDAIKHYEQALDNIEELRASLTKEHKLSFMKDKLFVYDELINLLQSLHKTHPDKGYDRKALETFERKQGRIFLEEMGQSGARLFAGLPQEIREEEFSLETQLVQVQKKITQEYASHEMNKDQIQLLLKNKEDLQNQHKALQERIRTEYSDYYALKYPQPVQLGTLQKDVLRDDELMLVYAVRKDSITLWVIGQQTFEMFDLPLGETALSKQVAQLRQLMGADDNLRGARHRRRKKREPQIDPLAKASYELYTRLIPEQVRSLLAAPYTVYIVPTGPLYALPFEALVTHKPSVSKDRHYLIEDVPIAYLSSASLLKIIREAQQRRQDTAPYPFLAFANPSYEPESTSEVSEISDILALRSQSYRALGGGAFAPLPETEDEAKEIAALLNAPAESEPLQLREAASRPMVFQLNEQKRLDDYQYILFATHGILPGEVDRVTQSALVLSHPDTKGYLTMADVFGIKLNAKFVSLSACNTGGGKSQRGEGVMGLTRAFMYAGTPAIGVTYWSVESFSAKTLSVGFFKQFKERQKPAAALRAIKLRLLHGKEGGKYKRPYYWAPFVVYGDAQ